jgi:hypothetical protein
MIRNALIILIDLKKFTSAGPAGFAVTGLGFRVSEREGGRERRGRGECVCVCVCVCVWVCVDTKAQDGGKDDDKVENIPGVGPELFEPASKRRAL